MCVLSVTVREIEVLYRRFKKLDRKRVGFISSQDFYLIPELSMNPLCDRVIALFDPQRSEQVTFDSFVQTVNLFHADSSAEERVKAVFQVYDMDGDGQITATDLLGLVRRTDSNHTAPRSTALLSSSTLLDALFDSL